VDAQSKEREIPIENLPDSLTVPYMSKISSAVEEFHANHQRLKDKDINSYKSLDQIKDAVHNLGLSQKKKRGKQRVAAQAGSTTIYENDDFWMIRPDTTEASCYYGKGTKWCISATQSQNYFKSYTSDGKSFYMIMMKNLDQDSDGKKIALVYGRDAMYDSEPEEIYDAVDNSIDQDEFLEYVTQNIIASHVPDYEEAYQEWQLFQASPRKYRFTNRLKKLVNRMLASGEYDTSIEENDITGGEYKVLSEAMAETFHNASYALQHDAAYYNEENPAGPNEEDYQEVIDAAGLDHVNVQFEDDGSSWGFWYEGTMGWDLASDLEYSPHPDTGEEADFDDWEDEISDIFRDTADDFYVYPDEVQASGYGHPAVNFSFRPDAEESGSLQAFQVFVERMAEHDSHYKEILEASLERMAEEGIIHSPGYEEKKAKFEKLPKLKNFDATFSKGKINFVQKSPTEVIIPLAQALGMRDLKPLTPRSSGDVYNSAANQWKEYLEQKLRILRNTMQHVFRAAYNETWPLAYDASQQKKKQGEMFVNEIILYGERNDPVQGDWEMFDVDLIDGGTLTGQAIFSRFELDDERGLQYMTWLDDNLNIFYDAAAQSILAYAQENAQVSRQHWPEKFKSTSQEADSQPTMEGVSYGTLCESWKSWATK